MPSNKNRRRKAKSQIGESRDLTFKHEKDRKHIEEILDLSTTKDYGKNIFDKIKEEAKKLEIDPTQRGNLDWYFQKVHEYYSFTAFQRAKIIQASKRVRTYVREPFEGRMIIFRYEPQDKRQVYDNWPCIFTTKRLHDGFMGINLHYHSVPKRAMLFDWLLDSLSGNVHKESSRLRISQNLLKRRPRVWDFIQPTIRRYKYNRVRGRFLLVPPVDWATALFLPFEQFRNKSRTAVYRDTWLETNKESYGIK